MAKKVIVIGGGVAGMSAAHELVERGFEVEVYERNSDYKGGKARSVDVPGSNKVHPDKYLPGEHGFRFFPGFYRHITDTMSRIPHKDATVFENLVEVNRVEVARFDKKPIVTIVNFPQSLDDVKTAIGTLHADTGLTKEEEHVFAHKLWQLMTSCYDRRVNDYERVGWWEFMDADKYSTTYQSLLVEGLTRTLVAANAKYASTKTGGDIFLQLIFNMANPFKHTDRVLNGPTNDVWLNPWSDHLLKSGVKYTHNAEAKGLDFSNGLINGVWVSTKGGEPVKVTGDYYILATPVEVAATLINNDMISYDMTLEGIRELADSVAWMNGLQFYLSEDVHVVHGHCIYADSPWAITSISQLQFWDNYDIEQRGDGSVKGILSVDISDWDVPGLNGKTAKECSPEDVMKEVWAQMKKSLNVNGEEVLRDDMIVSWYLDSDIQLVAPNQEIDYEPLLVNKVNTWSLRPNAYTRIKNFFLASDYVRTYTDLATMEGANEAARRAVNCIIDVSDSDADKCDIWNLHEPAFLDIFRHRDKKRYEQGLPYEFKESLLMKITVEGLHLAKNIASLFTKEEKV